MTRRKFRITCSGGRSFLLHTHNLLVLYGVGGGTTVSFNHPDQAGEDGLLQFGPEEQVSVMEVFGEAEEPAPIRPLFTVDPAVRNGRRLNGLYFTIVVEEGKVRLEPAADWDYHLVPDPDRVGGFRIESKYRRNTEETTHD